MTGKISGEPRVTITPEAALAGARRSYRVRRQASAVGAATAILAIVLAITVIPRSWGQSAPDRPTAADGPRTLRTSTTTLLPPPDSLDVPSPVTVPPNKPSITVNRVQVVSPDAPVVAPTSGGCNDTPIGRTCADTVTPVSRNTVSPPSPLHYDVRVSCTEVSLESVYSVESKGPAPARTGGMQLSFHVKGSPAGPSWLDSNSHSFRTTSQTFTHTSGPWKSVGFKNVSIDLTALDLGNETNGQLAFNVSSLTLTCISARPFPH